MTIVPIDEPNVPTHPWYQKRFHYPLPKRCVTKDRLLCMDDRVPGYNVVAVPITVSFTQPGDVVFAGGPLTTSQTVTIRYLRPGRVSANTAAVQLPIGATPAVAASMLETVINNQGNVTATAMGDTLVVDAAWVGPSNGEPPPEVAYAQIVDGVWARSDTVELDPVSTGQIRSFLDPHNTNLIVYQQLNQGSQYAYVDDGSGVNGIPYAVVGPGGVNMPAYDANPVPEDAQFTLLIVMSQVGAPSSGNNWLIGSSGQRRFGSTSAGGTGSLRSAINGVNTDSNLVPVDDVPFATLISFDALTGDLIVRTSGAAPNIANTGGYFPGVGADSVDLLGGSVAATYHLYEVRFMDNLDLDGNGDRLNAVRAYVLDRYGIPIVMS